MHAGRKNSNVNLSFFIVLGECSMKNAESFSGPGCLRQPCDGHSGDIVSLMGEGTSTELLNIVICHCFITITMRYGAIVVRPLTGVVSFQEFLRMGKHHGARCTMKRHRKVWSQNGRKKCDPSQHHNKCFSPTVAGRC